MCVSGLWGSEGRGTPCDPYSEAGLAPVPGLLPARPPARGLGASVPLTVPGLAECLRILVEFKADRRVGSMARGSGLREVASSSGVQQREGLWA